MSASKAPTPLGRLKAAVSHAKFHLFQSIILNTACAINARKLLAGTVKSRRAMNLVEADLVAKFDRGARE